MERRRNGGRHMFTQWFPFRQAEERGQYVFVKGEKGQSCGLLPFDFSVEGESPSSVPERQAGRDMLMLAFVR